MSIGYTIIAEDRATTAMQKFLSKMESDDVKTIVGRSVTNDIQSHFSLLDEQRPNKLGGQRTHYYEECAEGTSFVITEDGALVSITKEGIRTRVLGTSILPGGAIKPVNAKHLAIPAIAEAYGHSPLEFDHLIPLFRKGEDGVEVFALAEDVDEVEERPKKFRKTEETVIDHGNLEARIYFWLVDEVVQDGDRTLLPEEETLRANAFRELDDFFADVDSGAVILE